MLSLFSFINILLGLTRHYMRNDILFDKQQQQGDNMIKVFTDSYDNKKFFYHFNLFGLKFRIATNTRGFNKYGTYTTGRGRVLNFGRKYICFIPMF